jgi:hypothetical protein
MTPELAVKRAHKRWRLARPKQDCDRMVWWLLKGAKKEADYYNKKAARDQIDLSSHTFFLHGGLSGSNNGEARELS